jgi:NADH dehydrogenase
VSLQNVIITNVIWAAGRYRIHLQESLQESVTRGSRFIVDRFNKIENLENVYALGDIAFMTTLKNTLTVIQVVSEG